MTTRGATGAVIIHEGVASFGTVAPAIMSIEALSLGDTHQADLAASQPAVFSSANDGETRPTSPNPTARSAKRSHKRFIYIVYSKRCYDEYMFKKVLVSVILVAIIVLGVMLPINLTSNTPASRPSDNNETVNTKPQLTIPGAAPIHFEHTDFAKESSIWTVVSKTRPLANMQYVPTDLKIPDVPGNEQKSVEERSVRAVIETSLQEIFKNASSNGHSLIVASGYRSYTLQQQYYQNYVRTSGEAEANKFSAKPGYSEHQTGLAVDISLASRECYLETCFGETSAGTWLRDNAHLYGFIMRYPQDKTAITGYQYEPWHFRYVGIPLAEAIHRSGKALDEIVPVLQSTHDELVKNGTISE